MFKIYSNDIEYISTYENLKKKLNSTNIKKLSKRKIELIGKNLDPLLFSNYKRNLFFDYFDKNIEYSNVFIADIKKIVFKLDLNLKSYEYKYINELIKENFNFRRAKKSIDLPFKLPESMKHKHAFFLVKEASFFDVNDYGVFRFKTKSNLYFFSDSIIIANNDEIIYRLEVKNIKSAKLENKLGVVLKTINNTYLLTNSNPKIINIFLKRMYSNIKYI